MLSLSALVAVAFGTLFYAFSVLITEEAAGAEFSITVLSVAWSGSLLVGGGIAFLVGRHVDRHGVRGIMGWGAVLGAAGLALVAAAEQPWQVILASWVCIGTAGAMTFYEPAFVAVDQWFGDAGRLRALALLTVIGGLAGPIFIPLTSFLVSALGWRPAALVLGGMVLVTGVGVAAVVFPSGSDTRRTTGHSEAARVRSIIRDRRFTFFTAATLLTFASLQAVFLHRIAVFEEAGFGVAAVAAWAALAGVLSLPGRFAAPFLSRRVRPVRLTAVANLVLALAVAFAVVATAAWQMAAHFILFGLAFGALLPLRAVVMSGWFSGPDYGRIMGTQWSITAIVAAAGPLLVGVTRDSVGSYPGSIAAVAIAFAVAAGLSAASAPPSER